MTEGQREIATAILIDPDASLSYNLSFSLHLQGRPDRAALEQAIRAVVDRHDSLRATFHLDGMVLRIHPAAAVTVEVEDLTGLAPADRTARRDALHDAIAGSPFDLARGPMVRALLLLLGPDRAELVLFVHHIACDGWSIGVVVRDLGEFYAAAREGRAPRLDPAASIADLAAAERAWEGTPEAAAQRAWWVERFADGVPATDLPTDRPHPPVKTTAAGRVTSVLDEGLEARLRARAQGADSALRTLLFGAFALYLSRLTGARDVVIGLPASGQLAHGLEDVVGHGINFLPVRLKVEPGLSLARFLARVRQEMLETLDHQNITYGALMRELRVVRDPSRVAMVPVIVNIDNLADIVPDLPGLTARLCVNATGHEHFEIFLNLLDQPGRVTFDWNYNRAIFDHATMERHAANFLHLLEAMAAAPAGEGPVVERFLAGRTDRPASGTEADPGAAGPQTITERFRAVAAAMPGNTALRFGAAAMDYATLDALSDALAARLVADGVRPGELVGISAHRSLALPVAVLGALKAGAGYVPFDPALPAERLAFMAQDTGIRVLLGHCPPVTATGVATLAQADFPPAGTPAPQVEVTGGSAAYVMFTSGTTGTPKGVVLPHRSVIRMLVDTDWLRLGPDTVTLHSSAFAFDTSIIDFFGALLHGGTMVIPPDGALSIADLAAAIADRGVNTLWLTSGLFHAVADARPDCFARVDQVIVGGDVVSPAHVARVMDACPGITVINGYGPTESNVTNAHAITRADIASGMSLPIGRAIPGTQIWILDDTLQPVPTGTIGELAIAGRGLAKGYWNRPELTAEKFVTAPWDPGLTLYRSGDLAMDPGDGVIRFFGRMDTQVKIRGFRVELAEVEAALESHPGIRQATAVALLPEGQTDRILVAYYVAGGADPGAPALAAHVADRLPVFARPAFFVALPEMPLNQNGKVDRRRLPAPTPADAGAGEAGPASPAEARLAAIWESVLGVKGIGPGANFFELGGHSLLAVRLFDRIRREYGADLPISTLFQHQTLRELAAILPAGDAPATAPAPRAALAAATGTAMATATATDPGAPWDTSTVIHPGPAGGGQPVFIVGGIGGNVNNLFLLGSEIGRNRPVIGFQTRGVQGHAPHETIEAMAAENIRYMRRHQARGPYLIAGYSGGGYTALEMARQLEAAGETVERLFILDTFAPGFATDFVPKVRMGAGERLRMEWDMLREEGAGQLLHRARLFLRSRIERGPYLALLRHISLSHYRYRIMEQAWRAAARRYRAGPFGGEVTLFVTEPTRPILKRAHAEDPTLGWGGLTGPERLERIFVGGDHLSMLAGQNAPALAALIEERARAAERAAA
jgi:amino acid adenylation domain-containing protein